MAERPEDAAQRALPDISHYRVTFSKKGVARFTGHLDLQRSWERALRRASLKTFYTKGYHPRPRLQFAAPLPLGLTGAAELLDLWLVEHVAAEELTRRLREVLPPGIGVEQVEELPPTAPRVTKLLRSADYEVQLGVEVPPHLVERIEELLAQERIERVRREKAYDLRPLILGLSFDQEQRRLRMTLVVGQATGRAEEVLRSLGFDPSTVRIERTALSLKP